MSKYIFYPGCSMEKNAGSYNDSLRAVSGPLNIELEEIDDWNCCGATEYATLATIPAYSLIGRNLALAQKQSQDPASSQTLVASCSACYLNLAKTDYYMRKDKQLNQNVNEALSAGGLHYKAGSVQVRHILDVIVNDIGLDKVKEKVVKPLKGLRIAPYYGCLIVRPDLDKRFDSREYPTSLDRLLEALGAEVIDFPMKAHCCSGHMTQISEGSAYEMIRKIVHGATEYKADLMVTLCPMCQLNLDVYQVEMNKYFNTAYKMPVLYFTQLMGLAMGSQPGELGIGKEFVSARPALAKIGVELPEGEETGAAPKPKRSKDALPMPQMRK